MGINPLLARAHFVSPIQLSCTFRSEFRKFRSGIGFSGPFWPERKKTGIWGLAELPGLIPVNSGGLQAFRSYNLLYTRVTLQNLVVHRIWNPMNTITILFFLNPRNFVFGIHCKNWVTYLTPETLQCALHTAQCTLQSAECRVNKVNVVQ